MVRSIVTYCLALVAACGDDGRTAPLVLKDVAVTTAEDTAVAVTVPVVSAEPSAVAMAVVTPPGHGTLAGAGPGWTYTPAADYSGPDMVVVRGQDSHGSATATVTITVTPVNDAPIARPDSFATGFDTPLTVAQTTLLANDTDPDTTTLAVTGVAAAADGHGTPSMAGGNVVFTPDHGFTGAASYVYTVSDGALTAQATVTVTVGADLAPVAVDDAATTDEDTTLVIADATLLGNDSDPDHQMLAITATGAASHGTVTHGDTHISFVPEPNFHGTDTFTYTITDGFLTAVATVTVTVSSVDDPPVAVGDAVTVAEASADNAIDVLANDTDIDGGAKAIASVTQPAHGSAAVAPDGKTVSYTPAAGYCNQAPNAPSDTFTYALTPGGTSAPVAVKVTCACGLHKPTDFVVGSN